MAPRNYRVDFRFKPAGYKRFHKAYTFVLTETPEEAAARIIEVRPGEKVEIIGTPYEVLY